MCYTPTKTSTKEFCDTIVASIVRYEKYRYWASKFMTTTSNSHEDKVDNEEDNTTNDIPSHHLGEQSPWRWPSFQWHCLRENSQIVVNKIRTPKSASITKFATKIRPENPCKKILTQNLNPHQRTQQNIHPTSPWVAQAPANQCQRTPFAQRRVYIIPCWVWQFKKMRGRDALFLIQNWSQLPWALFCIGTPAFTGDADSSCCQIGKALGGQPIKGKSGPWISTSLSSWASETKAQLILTYHELSSKSLRQLSSGRSRHRPVNAGVPMQLGHCTALRPACSTASVAQICTETIAKHWVFWELLLCIVKGRCVEKCCAENTAQHTKTWLLSIIAQKMPQNEGFSNIIELNILQNMGLRVVALQTRHNVGCSRVVVLKAAIAVKKQQRKMFDSHGLKFVATRRIF